MGSLKMKKIFYLFLAMILMTGMAMADPFLACDNPTDFVPTVCEVEVNGVIQTANCTVSGADVLLLDLAGLAAGNYTFKARWHTGDGWWSEWSVPYIATKPEKPLNVRRK
jgi:hypothetical protein